ncbi:MAG TPA: hypothetical protein VM076_17290 [Gemmatimonadaceae bacterium]|nr:hypothetical protein [Gemmatimonadaceae bacterium]
MTPKAGHWRAARAVEIAAISLVVATGCSRDKQVAPPRLSGQVWHTDFHGEPLAVYLTREERGTSVPLSDEVSSRTDPYSRFYLVVRRIPSGAVLHSIEVGDVPLEADAKIPDIIGFVGDVMWLWRGEPEARRLSDLSIIASPRTLAGREAGSESDQLPTDRAAYTIAPNPVALIARGRDARFYVVDAVTSSVKPFDPATLPPSYVRVEDRFGYLQPPGRARTFTHPFNVMQQSFLTSDKSYYALLSESERASVSRWPSGEDHPSGEVARSLFRGPYRTDDRQRPEVDLARLAQVGSERLIQAGFVVRRQFSIWDVPDPSSSLVLAKPQLGADTPWDVVRLARDGSVLWRTSTGMAGPTALVDFGSHIGFVGPVPGPSQPVHQLVQLVWIDQRTGAKQALAIGSGELVPAPAASP